MAHFNFVVPEIANAKRLDAFLAVALPQYSRSFLAEKCHLNVNDASAKPSQKVVAGDRVTVGVPALRDLTIAPEAIPLDIVFEDADILVVNKPAGMVVHPTDHGGHVTGTLVNALLHHLRDVRNVKDVQIVQAERLQRAQRSNERSDRTSLRSNNSDEPFRPGLVHRLDRETSGLIVIAKTDVAKASLTKQFTDRTVEKEYLALLVGSLPTDTGRIDAPIARGLTDRMRREVRIAPDAREAITEFVVAERFPEVTLARVHILTGRTHQIRVHFSSIGHPVVGDVIYGHPAVNEKFNLARQFLHAAKLSFTHPTTGKRVTFETPLPPELAVVLKKLSGE